MRNQRGTKVEHVLAQVDTRALIVDIRSCVLEGMFFSRMIVLYKSSFSNCISS